MSSLLIVPLLETGTIAWLAAILAAAGGGALHVVMPPRDPAVAEAILAATVHP
jgi:hypothetical protein